MNQRLSHPLLNILAVSAACYFGATVLIPLMLALILFLALIPFARWASGRGIPRVVSAPVLVLLAFVLGGGVLTAGYHAGATIAEDVPQYSEKIRGNITTLQQKYQALEKKTNGWMHRAAGPGGATGTASPAAPGAAPAKSDSNLTGAAGFLLHGLNTVLEGMVGIIMVGIVAFFLLLESDHLGHAVRGAMPAEIKLPKLLAEAESVVRGFFVGNLLVGLVAMVPFFAVFSILGLENKVTLAIAAGFLNLIPLLGIFLGAILPIAQAYLQFNTLTPFLVIIVSSGVIHLVVENMVFPKVVGAKVNVNATAAIVGLIYWGWLWGALGVILAVPFMAFVRIYLEARPETAPWAGLIAEGPAGPRHRSSGSGPMDLARTWRRARRAVRAKL